MEALGDGQVAVADAAESVREGFAFGREGMAPVQKVGDFIIFPETLAGGTGNQVTAGGLQLQDAPDLPKLLIIGQRTAAEFGHDTFKHGFPPSLRAAGAGAHTRQARDPAIFSA